MKRIAFLMFLFINFHLFGQNIHLDKEIGMNIAKFELYRNIESEVNDDYEMSLHRFLHDDLCDLVKREYVFRKTFIPQEVFDELDIYLIENPGRQYFMDSILYEVCMSHPHPTANEYIIGINKKDRSITYISGDFFLDPLFLPRSKTEHKENIEQFCTWRYHQYVLSDFKIRKLRRRGFRIKAFSRSLNDYVKIDFKYNEINDAYSSKVIYN